MTKTPLAYLKEVRELLQLPENWTTGVYARNRDRVQVPCFSVDACCWCLMGAICVVTSRDNADWQDTLSLLGKHVGDVPTFNDTHIHEEVITRLDEIIAKEEALLQA